MMISKLPLSFVVGCKADPRIRKCRCNILRLAQCIDSWQVTIGSLAEVTGLLTVVKVGSKTDITVVHVADVSWKN